MPDISKSAFVQGFMRRCEEADCDAMTLSAAIRTAVAVRPDIEAEFVKCGFDKQAFGSGNGLQMPWMKPGTGIQMPRSQPAAPKPPGPPPVSQMGAKPPAPPKIMPNEPGMLGKAWQAVSSPYNPVALPFHGAAAVGDRLGSTDMAPHLFGFMRKDHTGTYEPSVSSASAPGPSVWRRAGSGLQSVFGLAGALPAVAADSARALTGESTNFDYSKMMARDALQGINTNFGTDIGHEVQSRPAGMRSDLHIGPDEGRQFFGEAMNPLTGERTPSATQSKATQYALEARRPDREGGSLPSRALNSAAAGTLEYAPAILSTIFSGLPVVSDPANAALAPLTMGGSAAVTEMLQNPATAELDRMRDYYGTLEAHREMQQAGKQPSQSPVAPPPSSSPSQPIAGAQVETAAPVTPATPATPPTAQQPESVLTQSPQYQEVAKLLQTAPEQAKAVATNALQQLHTAFSDPTGHQQVAAVAKTGGLTPEGQHRALTALTAEGYDSKQAFNIMSHMDGWEQLGLWGGIGIAGLGLLHAMSGGGGLASILMSLLGLGAAGFTAGRAGMLDQGAKDLTTGLTDAVSGGGAVPQIPAPIKKMFGNGFNHVPDSVLNTALKQVPTMSPELAAKLDQAAGVGSWGNATLGWLGDVSGLRGSKMQELTGLDPAQQDRLLQAWAAQRQ